MSKKTRKKSSKLTTAKKAAKKAVRAQSARSVKTAPSKARGATAAKTSKTKSRQTGNATAKASHKAPSKKLKSPSPGKSAPRTIKVSKTAATPAAENPPVDKTASEKPVESAVPRSAPSPLAEGAKAPAFSLPRDGGSTVSLKDYAGRKLVLFFYPRADTPGCTKEAIDFTRLANAFADAQTAVLGVSADPLKAQESFRNKHQLSTPFASDEQHEMLEAYGAWGEKSMYGKTFHGVLRTTILIGDDGRIIRLWRNVKVDGHADEVLAAARAA
jgi:thioredoxin-dependent peroxiredoxin